jgi:hypothetical protein
MLTAVTGPGPLAGPVALLVFRYAPVGLTLGHASSVPKPCGGYGAPPATGGT